MHPPEPHVMEHARCEERAEDEPCPSEQQAEWFPTDIAERIAESLMPSFAPELGQRRRKPRLIEERRPLFGILPAEEDSDNRVEIVGAAEVAVCHDGVQEGVQSA